MTGKLHIFHHIYCNENTLDILKEQIETIVSSGLYDIIDGIYCFITGSEIYIEQCCELIHKSGNKFSITRKEINDTTYERFTLLKIKEYINQKDKFLYIHTKGVKSNTIQVKYWRKYMEYFLITKYKSCIDYLDTFDTVGVNWHRTHHKKHYSGNFWWTTARYFLSLPDTIDDDYWSPEFYIGLNNPNYKELYYTELNLYSVSFLPDMYI